jgi:anion-transporting  ArsA/GET3 family ATPase
MVIASPEPDALREASYFVERLASEQMPLAGLVLNRRHTVSAAGLTAAAAEAAAERLESGNKLGAGVLRVHAERAVRAADERRLLGRFTAAHPRVPVVEVPAMAVDVHDLDGLRDVGAALGRPSPAAKHA